ncbi:MAG: WYL domain-containing protein [Treponema sp.]|nr:WYL domain-containing protein [Treponema sp.]
MPRHKTTHTQLERFRLIDSLLCDGEIVPFEKILDSLRLELRDITLSESSVRRDFRYMKNELGAPLDFDRKAHGWHYTKPFKMPAEGFSDDELLYLELIQKIVAQNSNDDFLYKSFDTLLKKITPKIDSRNKRENVTSDESDNVSLSGLTGQSPLSERFYITPRPKPLIDQGVVEKILDAIKHNYLLDFDYYSKWEPEERHRKIMPFQLVFDSGSLFLYGASSKDKLPNPRLFKLSKMHSVEVLTSKSFDLPPNFRFREDFEQGRFGAFQYDEEYDFKIEFYGEARTTVLENLWAENQIIEESPDEQKNTISFSTSQWIPVLRWVLSFGENACPLSPDWFVSMWKKSVSQMAKKL